MDFNFQSNDPNRYNGVDYSCRNPGMAMATASLLLGLASFFTIMTVILPFICGGLAILFALLSKGYGKILLTQAKIGIICGIGSLVMTVGILISSIALLLQNPDLLIGIGQQYDELIEDTYGESTEDIYGTSFEDMMKEYTVLFQQ